MFRKHISAEDLNSQLEIDFLLSKERTPRAFNDKSSELMFCRPISEEINCQLQVGRANVQVFINNRHSAALAEHMQIENERITQKKIKHHHLHTKTGTYFLKGRATKLW